MFQAWRVHFEDSGVGRGVPFKVVDCVADELEVADVGVEGHGVGDGGDGEGNVVQGDFLREQYMLAIVDDANDVEQILFKNWYRSCHGCCVGWVV